MLVSCLNGEWNVMLTKREHQTLYVQLDRITRMLEAATLVQTDLARCQRRSML